MKKTFLIFLFSFVFLFLFLGTAQALTFTGGVCDESNGGKNGIVPCGRNLKTVYTYKCSAKSINNKLWESINITLTPNITSIPGGNKVDLGQLLIDCKSFYKESKYDSHLINLLSEREIPACRCELSHIFILALNIYNFVLLYIAIPVTTLLIAIGGALIMISGGPGGKNPITGVVSPNLYSTAKNMIQWTVIAVILIFCSWLIIDVVLRAIGYGGAWSNFPL